MVTGGEWSRYINIPVRTSWPSVSMMDVIEDLEEEFEEWAAEKTNGFAYLSSYEDDPEEADDFEDFEADEDDDYDEADDYDGTNRTMTVMFFNEMGDGDELEFESMQELMRCIVSIRLVNVQNRIVKK